MTQDKAGPNEPLSLPLQQNQNGVPGRSVEQVPVTQGNAGQNEPLTLPRENAGPHAPLLWRNLAGVSEEQMLAITLDRSTNFESSSSRTPIVHFGSDSQMPPIVNLETAGLRRSPRISAQNKMSATRSWFKCNDIMHCFYVLSVTAASLWSPEASSLHSPAQALVFATANPFHSANQNFDNTLNAWHPMAFLAEKENNETYTFSQMLKQPDATEFVKAMIKAADDHESREHWSVVPCWETIFERQVHNGNLGIQAQALF